MDKALKPLGEKIIYILNQTTLVVDSSAVIDFHLQGLWPNLQESVPSLASIDSAVAEWKRNVPISSEERTRVVEWGKNLSTTLDSTSKFSPQELPTLELPCGVKVYPAVFLQGGTTQSISKVDYSQIRLVQSLEDYGQTAALLSSNHTQAGKLKTQLWDYKFVFGLLVATGNLSASDTRIDEMIKKDQDWSPNLDFKRYLTESFPAKVNEVYKKIKKQE